MTEPWIVELYGCHLGEVIVGTLGGRWEVTDDSTDVALPGNLRCFPLNRVAKCLDDGEDLVGYYWCLHALLERALATGREV